MTKNKVMAAVTVAGLVLSAGTSVFADDGVIIGGDNSVEIVENDHSSIVDNTGSTTPTETPSVEIEKGKIIGDNDSTVEDKTTDNNIINNSTDKKPELKTTPLNPDTSSSSKTENIIIPSNKDKEVEKAQDESSKENVKPVEPVIPDVEITNPVENPVVIETGTIISTDAGKVVVQKMDGKIETVAPESVGGKLEADGTVTVKDSKGSLKRLPNTGQEFGGSLAMTGVGLVGLFGVLFTKIKGTLWKK